MRDFMKEELGCIDFNTFTKIFDSGVPYAIKLNWRGEPLLHTHIVDLVAYAKQRGVMEVMLNTNGLLLTQELAEALANVGLDWLIISVDGATPQTYESIRTGGDFKKLFNNICSTRLLYLKLEKAPKIRIQICRQPINEHEIEAWKVIFTPFADELRVGNLFDPQGKRGYKIKQPNSCTSFWQRIVVDWKGNIYPCPSDYQGHWKLGNIEDTSIYNAWHCSRMNYFRHNLAKYGRQSVPACINCTSYC
jgi:radical SAM protein with 4Fe4S-binding SPASM domain